MFPTFFSVPLNHLLHNKPPLTVTVTLDTLDDAVGTRCRDTEEDGHHLATLMRWSMSIYHVLIRNGNIIT